VHASRTPRPGAVKLAQAETPDQDALRRARRCTPREAVQHLVGAVLQATEGQLKDDATPRRRRAAHRRSAGADDEHAGLAEQQQRVSALAGQRVGQSASDELRC
jgi:hypothetical protein